MLEHYCSFGADFGFDSESTIFVMESSMFIAIIVQTRLMYIDMVSKVDNLTKTALSRLTELLNFTSYIFPIFLFC